MNIAVGRKYVYTAPSLNPEEFAVVIKTEDLIDATKEWFKRHGVSTFPPLVDRLNSELPTELRHVVCRLKGRNAMDLPDAEPSKNQALIQNQVVLLCPSVTRF